MPVATVKMSRNGQIVIPKSLRDRLGLISGTTLLVAEVDGRVVLSPMRAKDLRKEFEDVTAAFDRTVRKERLREEEIVASVRRVRRHT